MTVSIREFKAHLSRYLAEARAGRPVEITSHRKVVARVTGVPEGASSGLARLIACGAATWEGGKPRGDHIDLNDSGSEVSALVLEQRG
ncbi:MAG: type II toxin-antitoxin system prevent-host-death family antitoxin [Gammaproteobacteria bacterium]|nr:type II toxin-antitoxin system prevent-host-death family antitoxin [Gammaproteobacteria bacterium]